MSPKPTTTAATPEGDGSNRVPDLDATMDSLRATALRVKAERDQALLDRARLVEALKEAITQAEACWAQASSLHDSKKSGEFARKSGALLRELGEL